MKGNSPMHRFITLVFAALVIICAHPAAHGAPAKNAKAAKSKTPADWRQTLKSTELLLQQGNASQGVAFYIAAIQGAETEKVSCSDPMFLELMAVGKELLTRGATPLPKTPDDMNKNAAVETALKWKLHAAAATCGNESAAVLEANENLASFYRLAKKNELASDYTKKAVDLNLKLIASQADEIKKFRDAGNARAKSVINGIYKDVEAKLDALKK